MNACEPTNRDGIVARNERNVVNLDALITRADLLGSYPPVEVDERTIRISDLEPSIIFDQLRKPDFQRETSNWRPDQVASLITTFAEQDIIPSLVLWQNGPHIFVIDGAHRLSALIAWVRDDYGAGEMSRKLFKEGIPSQQLAMHQETQRLIKEGPGTWADFSARLPLIRMKGLDAQWIKGKTPEQAGEAFIRINQAGTQIDNLEVRIIRSPRSALSVATRAIPRGGAGHEYWRHFRSEEARSKVPELGGEIHRLLFEPRLNTPSKTVELPLAGADYGMGAVRLAFDLVALSSGLKIPDSTSRSVTARDNLPADDTGEDTIRYLKRARAEVGRILSTDPGSFGLHPALYFYAGGAFQPAALLNMIAWFRALEKRNALSQFRKARGRFEALALAHPVIMKPPTHLLGTGGRTRTKMLKLFDDVLAAVSGRDDLDAVWQTLGTKYARLVGDENEAAELEDKGAPGGKFKSATKSAITLGDLSSIGKCPLCGGLMHPNGKVLDHRVKKADGGWSGVKDGRYVHPVCNSERDKDER